MGAQGLRFTLRLIDLLNCTMHGLCSNGCVHPREQHSGSFSGIHLQDVVAPLETNQAVSCDILIQIVEKILDEEKRQTRLQERFLNYITTYEGPLAGRTTSVNERDQIVAESFFGG